MNEQSLLDFSNFNWLDTSVVLDLEWLHEWDGLVDLQYGEDLKSVSSGQQQHQEQDGDDGREDGRSQS